MTSTPGSEYPWQRAVLAGHRLHFDQVDGLQRALRDGFFFVQPLQAFDLAPGDRFARQFYVPGHGAYQGFCRQTETELGRHQGYFCRDADQTEQFFLRSTHWHRLFPEALRLQAQCMKAMAIEVLLAVLASLDIPAVLWRKATGHCMASKGTHTLTFNHFRPQVNARGLNIHKDSGWVTVLRSLEPGLEVLQEP